MERSECKPELVKAPDGPELLDMVISLTGLPEMAVQKELEHIFHQTGQSLADLTLEQLREALAAYLEAIHSEILEEPASAD